MSNSMAVSESTFEHEVLSHSKEEPVLVDFWATWCGPCKMLAPEIDKIAKQFDGKLRVVKIDADDNPEVAQAYGVMGLPTLILFKDGEDVARVMGFQPKERILQQIGTYLEA